MSYCRFGWGGSDVYVFESMDGLTCCGCRLSDDGFVCAEPEDMIVHLAAHRRAGQFVPDSAIEELFADIPGAQRDAAYKAACQQVGWQPIATAPNHERVLLSDGHYVIAGQVWDGVIQDDEGRCLTRTTYWQPLPDPKD
jgi:hypothetical protein